MPLEGEYNFDQFWTDFAAVKIALRNQNESALSFDEYVAQVFDDLHGVNGLTHWQYGKFMLTCIYINTNKEAFDIGGLLVAGSNESLLGKELARRVLEYAVSNNLAQINEFPEPSFFIHPEDDK